jgi:hypothetical protein
MSIFSKTRLSYSMTSVNDAFNYLLHPERFDQVDYAQSYASGIKAYVKDVVCDVPISAVKNSVALIRTILTTNHDVDVLSNLSKQLYGNIFHLNGQYKVHYSLLFKELFYREDFTANCVLKIQQNFYLKDIICRTLALDNIFSFIVHSDSSHDLSKAFKNLLLCFRVLPPRQQIGLYHNLDQLITCGKEMASVHGQEWPETDSLVSCLFDFDSAPVSYSNSAKSIWEHQTRKTISLQDSLSNFGEITALQIFPKCTAISTTLPPISQLDRIIT